MQEKYKNMPLIKDYIRTNMPNGGYQMVSKRLEQKGVWIDNKAIVGEIRGLKKNNNMPVVLECLHFLKDNNIDLDHDCEVLLGEEGKSKRE